MAKRGKSEKKGGGCLRRLLVLGLLLCALGVSAGAIGFLWLEANLQEVDSFDAYRQGAKEHSRAFAAGGEMVARFGREVRTVVPIDQIPKTLLYAVVCAEDAAFYHHPGLDFLGIARALWVDVSQGHYVQGASTITQQFAKTRYLSKEKTIIRKLKELVLARKLEEKLSKDEILAMYVNEIYFGHGRYGVEEASRFYFGKPIGQIDIAQAALLAAVINAPSRFSPLRHPENARKRRSYVLNQMQRRGYISVHDVELAEVQALPQKGHEALEGQAPYYLSEVRREIVSRLGADALQGDGLRIELALDLSMQRAADKAISTGLKRIDRRYKVSRVVRSYENRAAMEAGLKRLKTQRKGRKAALGRPTLGVVRGFDRDRKTWLIDLGGERANLPEKNLERYRGLDQAQAPPRDTSHENAQNNNAQDNNAQDDLGQLPRFEKGDLLRVAVAERQATGTTLVPNFGPQVALIALEPGSRLVRAMVGGEGYSTQPFNRARRAKRQPGSTFKTFVYGAAIEAGLATPDSEVRDIKRTHISHGRPWTPRNYSGRYDGKAHTLRDALAHSINSIAVEEADRVTPAKVADFARRAGITSPLSEDLPLALGASSVSPEELANAYATIAAGGIRSDPIYITRVLDRYGREIFRSPHHPKRAFSKKISDALSDMLGEVVRKGSGRRSKVGRPVAGKTGTSNRGRDNWFVGFSPQLCTAVWVGYDDRKPIRKGSGARLALPIWSQFMREALRRVSVLPLPRLPHLNEGAPPPDSKDQTKTKEADAEPAEDAEKIKEAKTAGEAEKAGEAEEETTMPPIAEEELIDDSALEEL